MENFVDHLIFSFFLGAGLCALVLAGMAFLAFIGFVIELFEK